MQKIGLIGGAFDPIHFGHLYIAENSRERFKLDKVMFIPSGISPYTNKSCCGDKRHRLNMVKIAIEGNPFFEALDFEVAREAVSYTIDTIEHMESVMPNAQIFYIVGEDALESMPNWYGAERLFSKMKIIGVTRASEAVDFGGLSDRFGAEVLALNIPRFEISSTEIRGRIVQGRSVWYMLPEGVIEYICENKVYS